MSNPAVGTNSIRDLLASAGETRTPAARLSVAVVHDLVSLIVRGAAEPGSTLPPEGELSSHFAVSRTVIRESLKRIEEKGLVVVAQGRGTTVQPPEAWNMLDPVVLSVLVEHDDTVGILDDLSEVRTAIEAAMSGHTADRRSDDNLAALQAAHSRLQAAVKDPDEFAQADADFHLLVMRISGNRLAEGITRILFERARTSARFTRNQTAKAYELTLAEHQLVLDAIERGDHAAAQEAMRAHIADAWDRRRPPDSTTKSRAAKKSGAKR